jgi:hypothetical protein
MSPISRCFLALLALSSLAVGCAAEPTSDDAAAADEQDLSAAGQAAKASCGPTFAPAFAHYKQAVRLAKAHLAAEFACEALEGEAATPGSIADPAAAAVLTCPGFKEVIKTSPFAAPIRKVLERNLGLRALTGELLVLRDSEFQNWSGVEGMLPGTEFSTVPEGVAGLRASLELEANGVAKFTTIDNGPPPTFITRKTIAGTYTVEKTGGDRDPRTITIQRADGKTAKFRLDIDKLRANNFESAPDFMITPISGDIAAFDAPAFGHHDFYSYWHDCSI